MPREIRFAAFAREVTTHQSIISYNALVPKIEADADGTALPYRPPKLKLRPLEAYRVVAPYTSVRFIEQAKAVVPLAIYLVLFQFFILQQAVEDSWIITAGLFSVMVGLMLFMKGLKIGLMPFGEIIGNTLPTKSALPVVLLVVFLLGIGFTFAEPAIGALKTAGSIIDVTRAPYVYSLLNDWPDVLVLVVGVGLAAALGTLRFIYGWSLKPFIYLTLIPAIGFTSYMMLDPELSKVLGLAWDTQTEHRQLGDQTEKQILRVVVPAVDADDVFEFIYFETGIDKPHGGLILMARVDNFVPLILPDDIPEEDD